MLRVRNTTTTTTSSDNVVGHSKSQGGGGGGGGGDSHDQSSSSNSSSSKSLEIMLVVAILLFLYILFQPYTEDYIIDGGGDYYSTSSTNNKNQKQQESTLFQRYSLNAPPCSTPLLNKNEISYTLVTHTSIDRIWQMEYHCKLWNGPISLAVYTNRSLEQIEQLLQSDDMKCTVNRKYVTIQTLNPPSTTTADIYPVNELRNLALRAVRTTHIVIVDIDFWVSENLLTMLESPLLRLTMYKHQHDKLVRTVFILARCCFVFLFCFTPSQSNYCATFFAVV